MEDRKTLKQILVYHSPDGTLAGAADKMGISRQTLSTACSGHAVNKNTAVLISEFTRGAYTVAELMGIEGL